MPRKFPPPPQPAGPDALADLNRRLDNLNLNLASGFRRLDNHLADAIHAHLEELALDRIQPDTIQLRAGAVVR